MCSFMKISQMVFNSQSGYACMVEMAITQCSKGNNFKNRKPRVMCSAHRLIVLYISVKFHVNISNSFQVTEPIQVHGRDGYIQCSKGNNSRTRKPNVMVYVFCMSSHGALHLCEV